MKNIILLLCIVFVNKVSSQTATFNGNEKKISIIKHDTIPKKDSSFSERSMPRTYTRRGVSEKPLTKDDFKNIVYVFNGAKISMAQVDSITRNWDGVKCVDDLSKQPIERTITPLSKKEFADATETQKSVTSKKWNSEKMPAYSFTDINGKIYNSNELSGKVIVFNFWFIACAPCIREMPSLNKLVKKFESDSDIVFIGLALDSKDEVAEFLKRREFNYKQISDAGKFTRETMGISIWPTSMIVDKTGVIKFSFSGNDETEIQKMETIINELLNK